MNNDILEKIYSDFSDKLLPNLGERLTFTKDYFQDLFGKYIKYLIITDSLSIFFAIGVIIGGIMLAKKAYSMIKEEEYDPAGYILGLVAGLSIIISFIITIHSTVNLVKDLTVPEIRVYEKLFIQE